MRRKNVNSKKKQPENATNSQLLRARKVKKQRNVCIELHEAAGGKQDGLRDFDLSWINRDHHLKLLWPFPAT
jgi:hypothetical protein